MANVLYWQATSIADQSGCWKDKQAWQNNPFLSSSWRLIRLILSKKASVIFHLTILMPSEMSQKVLIIHSLKSK